MSVLAGNGGPPGPDNFREDCGDVHDCGSIPATRSQSVNYGYGRLIAHNETHLQFLQVNTQFADKLMGILCLDGDCNSFLN